MQIGTDVWVRQVPSHHNRQVTVTSSTRSPSPTVSNSFSSSRSGSKDIVHEKSNGEKILESGLSTLWLAATIIDKKLDQNGVVSITAKVIDKHVKFAVRNEHKFRFLVDECDMQEDLKYRMSSDTALVENLNDLPFLNEPEILSCLKARYLQDRIYTYTGSILIAVNPFKLIPGLYSEEMLTSFFDAVDSRSPHIWDIASSAYHRLLDELDVSADHANVLNYSILISGESGSGKTESCKYLLKHLTKAGSEDLTSSVSGSRSGCNEQRASIMDQIMDSNPILEAFGNSKTMRNNNSSRFGKYINLRFNEEGIIIGGSMQTYLLENIRVVNQQSGERNFHIFSHLLGGASNSERERWFLDDKDSFNYLNQGKAGKLSRVSETAKLQNLKESFMKLNFDSDIVDMVLDIAAGILHIGQINFENVNDSSGEVSKVADLLALQRASSLCGLSADELEAALTVRTVISRGEEFRKRLSVAHSMSARDAVAKAVYKKVFNWLINAINENIDSNANTVFATIGILDIFGFECFDKNSFEQLCINYANEALQKQFNNHVFELELLEYKKEGIDFNVAFTNNQESLDLIGIHIFKILDDQCKLPNATDERFSSQLYKELNSKPKFSATKKEQRDSQFTILHFAGPVQYSTSRFIEKNVDELPADVSMMLQHSYNSILSSFCDERGAASVDESFTTSQFRKTKQSLSHQFKEQLNELMSKLNDTVPFYVRCIKPIDLHAGDGGMIDRNKLQRFNESRVSEQLHNGGVFVAIKVARSGYAVRLQFYDFYCRYRFVANGYGHKNLPHVPKYVTSKAHCAELTAYLLTHILVDKEGDAALFESIQVGHNKVFLQQSYFNVLEKLKSRIILRSASKLQRFCKLYLNDYFVFIKEKISLSRTRVDCFLKFCVHRRRYLHLLCAVRKVQAMFRLKSSAQKNYASTIITKFFKNAVYWNKLCRYVTSLRSAQKKKKRKADYQLTQVVHAPPSEVLHMDSSKSEDGSTVVDLFATLSPGHQPVCDEDSLSSSSTSSLHHADVSVKRVRGPSCANSTTKKFVRPAQFGRLPPVLGRRKHTASKSIVAGSLRHRKPPVPVPSIANVSVCKAEYQRALIRELSNVSAVMSATAAVSPLLELDLLHIRNLLVDACKLIPKSAVRSSLQTVSESIDYGYKLLVADELNEVNAFGRLMNFLSGSQPKKWSHSARFEKAITADHKLFRKIFENISKLKDFKCASNEYLEVLPLKLRALQEGFDEGQQLYGQSYVDSYLDTLQYEVEEIQRVQEVVRQTQRVCELLIQYYHEYVATTVLEYGENSSYKTSFVDDKAYISSLSKLISLRQKLLRAECKSKGLSKLSQKDFSDDADRKSPLEMNNILVLHSSSDTACLNSASEDRSTSSSRFSGPSMDIIRCAKYMPYAPGVEFSCNFLLRLLTGEGANKSSGRINSVHVINIQSDMALTSENTNRLLLQSRFLKHRSEMIVKMVGCRPSHYSVSPSVLYQLSPLFAVENINDIISSDATLKSITPTSYSSVAITCLLFGVLHAKPENFIVRFDRNKHGNRNILLDGINIDKQLAENLFSYHMRENLFGLNVLFFFPQVDEVVDGSLLKTLTGSQSMPERFMCLWLRELRIQNSKYQQLAHTAGLSAADLTQLKLPIRFPAGTAVILYNRLQVICKLLRTKSHCTHRQILHTLYPSLLQFYKRKSLHRGAKGRTRVAEKLSVQQSYYSALQQFDRHFHPEKTLKSSNSAIFSFADIFPSRTTSLTFDRESVLSEISEARRNSSVFGSCDPEAKAPSLEKQLITTNSKSLDLQSIYCNILGRRNDLQELQPLKSLATSSSNLKHSLIVDSKSKDSSVLTKRTFTRKPSSNLPFFSTKTLESSFDYGDVFGPSGMQSDETLLMEPHVSGTLQQFSKAFKGKQQKPRAARKEPNSSVSKSVSRGHDSQHSERLKDYMFDPQVDFGDIYGGDDELFEMSAENIANPNNMNTKKEIAKSPARKKSRLEPVLIPESKTNNIDGLDVSVKLEAEDPFESFSSVEKLSMEFLTNIDFSDLQHEDGLSVCQLIGQSLHFIETVCFYRINATQLEAIFSQWLESAVSNNNADQNNIDPTKLLTKKIVLVDLNRNLKHAIKCSTIYFDLKNKLSMNVKFLSKDDSK